jgi:hypothetical protein
MREFTGKGERLAYLSDGKRSALFADLVEAINRNKLHSVSASVLEQDFKEFFPNSKFKGLFGQAPLALIWCMVQNIILAEKAGSLPKIAYLVANSDDSAQLLEAHSLLRECVETRPHENEHIGSLSFDSPKNVYALQAADMIAWSNRRKKLGEPFTQGFQPLERLTRHVKGERESFHFHLDATRQTTQQLADIINSEPTIPLKFKTIRLA